METIEPIPFTGLSRVDQGAAIGALEAAGGPTRLCARLGKSTAGFVIAVDYPRHASHYRDLDNVAKAMIDMMRDPFFPGSRAEMDDVRWLEVDRKWLPIVTGLELVLLPDGPDAELERRRAIVDVRRAKDEADLREAARKKKAQDDKDAEWSARNGARGERFRAAPREEQLLFLACDTALGDPDPARRMQGDVFRTLAITLQRFREVKYLPVPSAEAFSPTVDEIMSFRRWQQAHPEIQSEPVADLTVGEMPPFAGLAVVRGGS